jgi:hypothetical protein
VAKATSLRKGEKATNAATVAETAVAQALTVLKGFYAKAGEAASLVEQQPEAAAIFDSPY